MSIQSKITEKVGVDKLLHFAFCGWIAYLSVAIGLIIYKEITNGKH